MHVLCQQWRNKNCELIHSGIILDHKNDTVFQKGSPPDLQYYIVFFIPKWDRNRLSSDGYVWTSWLGLKSHPETNIFLYSLVSQRGSEYLLPEQSTASNHILALLDYRCLVSGENCLLHHIAQTWLTTWGFFYYQGLTWISAWINNHVPKNMWCEIIYPFPSFNGFTVEIW